MSVYLSNKRCEVNKDGSRKGHIEVNAKAEVPLGYDGIIEYEVKKANGKVASGKCRITNNNGDVEVCGPDGCRFKASADNSGVVCEPISEVIDFIYNLGDELMFSALSGALGNIKGLIDSGENGVPSSSSGDAGKSLVVDSNGDAKWVATSRGFADTLKSNEHYLTVGKYKYLRIAKFKTNVPSSPGKSFDFGFFFRFAAHVTSSVSGVIDIRAAYNTETKVINPLFPKMSMTIHESNRSQGETSGLGVLGYNWGIVVEQVDDDHMYLTFVVDNTQGAANIDYVPITIYGSWCDEDMEPLVYGDVKWTVKSAESLPDTYKTKWMTGDGSLYAKVAVPVPPSSGTKTLKSVDGVIQWT